MPVRDYLSKLSKRVISSYVLDWIAILALGLISYGFHSITPHYHPFSLVDLTISYPYTPDTVTPGVLIVVSVLVPVVVIFLVNLLLVPGWSTSKRLSWLELIHAKLWELNSSWLGLALSHVITLLITQGVKNIIGKPRPDCLARCQPDLANVAQYQVGGVGESFSQNWILVDQRICQQGDKKVLVDGFRSFPSGHSSTSFAGLLYLSLYLAAKFTIAPPHLPSKVAASSESPTVPQYIKDNPRPPNNSSSRELMPDKSDSFFSRLQYKSAAAPPLYLLIFIFVPIGGAIYISASRFMDYRHYGFDILSGSLIGIVTAYFGFRFYHPPISKGTGWAWDPRSPDRAFGISAGLHGYVDEDSAPWRGHQAQTSHDLEMCPINRSVNNDTPSYAETQHYGRQTISPT